MESNHTKQIDSAEKAALVLATQLTSARKWRNSSNNQVTDALKSMPNPLTTQSSDKLLGPGTNSAKTYNQSQEYWDSTAGNGGWGYHDNTTNDVTQGSYGNMHDTSNNASSISSQGSYSSPASSALTSPSTSPPTSSDSRENYNPSTSIPASSYQGQDSTQQSAYAAPPT